MIIINWYELYLFILLGGGLVILGVLLGVLAIIFKGDKK